jgi:hypothetical protein
MVAARAAVMPMPKRTIQSPALRKAAFLSLLRLAVSRLRRSVAVHEMPRDTHRPLFGHKLRDWRRFWNRFGLRTHPPRAEPGVGPES